MASGTGKIDKYGAVTISDIHTGEILCEYTIDPVKEPQNLLTHVNDDATHRPRFTVNKMDPQKILSSNTFVNDVETQDICRDDRI